MHWPNLILWLRGCYTLSCSKGPVSRTCKGFFLEWSYTDVFVTSPWQSFMCSCFSLGSKYPETVSLCLEVYSLVFVMHAATNNDRDSAPTKHGFEQYAGYLENVFHGHHLDGAVPRISEAVYCLTPSLAPTNARVEIERCRAWFNSPWLTVATRGTVEAVQRRPCHSHMPSLRHCARTLIQELQLWTTQAS